MQGTGELERAHRNADRSRIAVYSAAFVALGLLISSLGPTLPGLASHTGSTLGSVSILFVARASGYFAGALGGGRVFDRFRGHPLIAANLIVTSVAMMLAPSITWLALLSGLMFVLGITEGVLDVGVNTFTVWTFRDRSGSYLNTVHFSFAVGAFLAPVIVARAIEATGDITRAYWVLAVALVPVAVWFWFVPSPSRSAEPEGAVTVSIKARRGLVTVLALIVAFYFIYIGAEASLGGWIYSYALELRLENETGAAYLTSVFWGALAAGRLVAIPVAAHIRPRHILVVALVASIASIVVILAFPGSVWAARAGSAGAGFAMASVFPTMLALAGRHVPITGKINSLVFAGASAGSIVFPWLIGQLFAPFGPRSAMVVILACAVGALAMLGAILAAISSLDRDRRST